jgi:serine protease Do
MVNFKFLLPPALAVSLFAAGFSILPTSTPSQKPGQQDVLLLASQALHQVAKRATPAVVSITSIRNPEFEALEAHEEGNPLDQAMMGVGSGVIVRPDGLILTNFHVVQNAEKVTVLLDEKHKLPAHVVGGDSKTDLAVIQLDSKARKGLPLPTLPFGDSDQLQVGDWTLAVGSPYGLSRSVTSGIVSAVGRGRLGMLDIEDFIQTDAAINPGNSGGPLLNSSGEMIGINTAIFSQSGGFSGIGFAVPSKIAKQVFDEIVSNGRVIRGWIGMMAQDMDNDLAGYFKAPSEKGALVSAIQPNSPASQATLKVGDIITKYGAQSVASAGQLKALVSQTKSTTRIPVQFYREGDLRELSVLIREQPNFSPAGKNQMAGQAAPRRQSKPALDLGLIVQDIPKEILTILNKPSLDGALVTAVQAGSPAFDAGISIGDIILSANKHAIQNAQEFKHVLKKTRHSDLTVFYVQRGPDEKLFVPVRQEHDNS